MTPSSPFLRRLTAELASCLALAMFVPSAVRAATWDGNGALPPTGFWNDPMNWVGNLTPLFTDDAFFALDDIYTVKFTTAEQIDDLNILDGDVSFNMPVGSLRVLGNLSIANASLSIPGLLKSGVPAANQVGVGGLIILDNGTLRAGALNLGATPATTLPWLSNSTAGILEINDSDITIGTGGMIGSAFTASAGKTLRVVDTAGGSTTGTLTVGSSGSLHVSGGGIFARSLDVSGAGAFSFTSGSITIDGGVFTPVLGTVNYETGAGTLGYPNAFAISSPTGSGNRPTLTLQNGATTAAVADALVIGTLGGKGGLVVDGMGTLLQDSGFGTLDIGLGRSADGVHASDGELEISGGGKVAPGFSTRIAVSGGTANVSVSGVGSELAPFSGGITVGESRFWNGITSIGSNGSLTVTDGGLARGYFQAGIGTQGGTGTVSVDGVGTGGVSSTLSVIGSGSLNVGYSLFEDAGVNHGVGNGTLNVTNGGQATSSGFASIGSWGGTGAVTIDGIGTGDVASKLSASFGITVGNYRYFSYLAEADLGAGTGTLALTNGGRADGGFDFRIGTTGGLGLATVDGIGTNGARSTLETAGSLYVGEGRFIATVMDETVVSEGGNGTLNVTYGGLATSAGETFIGYSGGTGNVTISSVGIGGVAAKLDVGTGLRVGYQQYETPGDTVGTLTLTNGGQLASGTLETTDAYIGAAGGTGTVNVASLGLTSLWTHDGNVLVGTDGTTAGTGTLNVGYGGSVIIADTIEVAAGGTYNHSGGNTFTTSLDLSAAGGFQFTGGQITVDAGTFSPKLGNVAYQTGTAGLFTNSYAISGIVPGASSGPTLRLQNGAVSTTSGNAIVLGTLGGWGRVIVSNAESKLRTATPGGSILVGMGRTQNGADASTGILAIDDGGVALASADIRIGVQGGGGTSTVAGIGTDATRSGLASGAEIIVGDNRFIAGPLSHAGSGSLAVTGGAFAASSDDFSIGYQGGLGVVTVAGDGTGNKGPVTYHYNSTLYSLEDIYVGRERAVSGGVDFGAGDGALNINAGGIATSTKVTYVGLLGGKGTLNVSGVRSDGTRSELSASAGYSFGQGSVRTGGTTYRGTATVSVTDGGRIDGGATFVSGGPLLAHAMIGSAGGLAYVSVDGISAAGIRSTLSAEAMAIGSRGFVETPGGLSLPAYVPGTGNVAVTHGGIISSGSIYIGESGGLGTVTLDGGFEPDGGIHTASALTAINNLHVGSSRDFDLPTFAGNGSLTITNGGRADATSAYVGNNGGIGSVTIDGIGADDAPSEIDTTLTLAIGDGSFTSGGDFFASQGTLAITNGGLADNHNETFVGSNGGIGAVTIDGVGIGGIRSTVLTPTLRIGVAEFEFGGIRRPGEGAMTISNGGLANSWDAFVGDAGGDGTVTLDGISTGGVRSEFLAGSLTVGHGGVLGVTAPLQSLGDFSVLDGARAATTGDITIGSSGGIGAANVSGIGAGGIVSEFSTGTLRVGYDTAVYTVPGDAGSLVYRGDGSLHIADGGLVSAIGGVIIGENGGLGDLHVDGVTVGGIRSELTSSDLMVGSGRVFTGTELALHRGVGTMSVSGGGLASSGLVGVGVVGGQGTMTLTGQSAAGVSSRLDAASLSVGVGGRFGAGEITGSIGSLSVLAGAHAVSAGMMGIGTSGGTGSTEILGTGSDGTQSRLSATSLAVGSSRAMDGATELAVGDGSLHVADGGQVVLSSSLTVGEDGGHGALIVEGVGADGVASSINVSDGDFALGFGGLYLGSDTSGLGQGNASILSGASVLAGGVLIGSGGGTGTVLVDGVDTGGARSSLLGDEFSPSTGAAFRIGDYVMYTSPGEDVVGVSEGSLTVSNGGMARAGTFLGVDIGVRGGHGNLHVDGVSSGGEASRFDITCHLKLGNGVALTTLDPLPFRSEGIAAVTNGGQLTSGSYLLAETSIGSMGGIGTLTVASSTANVSSWVQTGNAHLGAGSSDPSTLGTGTLNLGTGGLVDISDTLHVYHSTSTTLGESGGLVNLDGGTLKVAALDLQGESTGLDWTSGTLWLNGGTSNVGAVTVPTSGTLKGNGTVTGDILNHGTVSIGESPGLMLADSFTQSSTGNFVVEINGSPSEPSLWDRLVVSGNIVLDGILHVNFGDTVATALDDTWTFLSSTAGFVTGIFSSISIDAPDGLTADDFTIDYGSDYVQVRRGSSMTGVTYDTWKLDYTWPGDSATTDNWDQDPDHDGHNNLLEYAFGTDPLTSDLLPITATVTSHAGNDYLTLIYTRPAGANVRTDLAYRVVRSTDLTPATTTDLVSDLPVAGDPETVITRSSSIYRSVDREFLQAAVHFTILPAP